ncbi:hypothetical protein D3C71_1719930 [compost metagenome]
MQARIAFQITGDVGARLRLVQPLLLYRAALQRMNLRGPVDRQICVLQAAPLLPGRIPVRCLMGAALHPGQLRHAICHGLQLDGCGGSCCITCGAGRGSSGGALWAVPVVQRGCHREKPVRGEPKVTPLILLKRV